MGRLQLWGAALALLFVIFVGGGSWFAYQLRLAHREGEAIGRAEIASALEAETERRRTAGEAALAKTNAQIADLERTRDLLQEQYNALVAQAIRDSRGDRLCLGPGLVRSLDAIGRGAGSASARP
jgi:hypothetical protein